MKELSMVKLKLTTDRYMNESSLVKLKLTTDSPQH